MSHSNPPTTGAAMRFYDNYLNCLHKASIPEKQRRWYVKRIEAFIRAHSGRKIKSLTCQEVSGYLEMVGRQNRLTGWQFAQCSMQYGFFIVIYSQHRPARTWTGNTGKIRPGNLMLITQPRCDGYRLRN